MSQKVAIFLGSIFAFSPFANAQELDDRFREAILAVESRDYVAFERLLDQNPQLLTYRSDSGCPILCELMFLFRDEIDGDIPGVDLRALQIALTKGAPPDSYPNLTSQLLAIANTTQSGFEGSDHSSEMCLRSRKPIFEMLNMLMQSGTIEMKDGVKTSSGGEFSAAFVYSFQLCSAAHVCGADFEELPDNLTSIISESLSPVEATELRSLSTKQALNPICTSSLLQ